MKKLGLVGGMGPESTVPYYREINFGVQKAFGEEVFPEMSMESINLYELQGYLKAEDYDNVTAYLLKAIRRLEKCDVDFIALGANTPHIVFERLQQECKVPMLSIVEAACAHAMKKGYKKIGLMGTIFTMSQDFFKKPFVENGIEIVVPHADEQELINDRLYHEIELGIQKPETTQELIDIIARMAKEDGIEAVVLGCTELPLVLSDDNSPIPTLDTLALHIEAIVNTILEK